MQEHLSLSQEVIFLPYIFPESWWQWNHLNVDLADVAENTNVFTTNP